MKKVCYTLYKYGIKELTYCKNLIWKLGAEIEQVK